MTSTNGRTPWPINLINQRERDEEEDRLLHELIRSDRFVIFQIDLQDIIVADRNIIQRIFQCLNTVTSDSPSHPSQRLTSSHFGSQVDLCQLVSLVIPEKSLWSDGERDVDLPWKIKMTIGSTLVNRSKLGTDSALWTMTFNMLLTDKNETSESAVDGNRSASHLLLKDKGNCLNSNSGASRHRWCQWIRISSALKLNFPVGQQRER